MAKNTKTIIIIIVLLVGCCSFSLVLSGILGGGAFFLSKKKPSQAPSPSGRKPLVQPQAGKPVQQPQVAAPISDPVQPPAPKAPNCSCHGSEYKVSTFREGPNTGKPAHCAAIKIKPGFPFPLPDIKPFCK